MGLTGYVSQSELGRRVGLFPQGITYWQDTGAIPRPSHGIGGRRKYYTESEADWCIKLLTGRLKKGLRNAANEF
jgi:DNA-binding transcriptional MerR regulator